MVDEPNVVLVVMDTARADLVDARFDGEEVTPNLSELAASGTRFTRAYSTAPWTLPSHASLFTGTYPSRHGAHADSERLGDDLRTLPAVFSEAGYDSIAVSNNVWVSDAFGLARGFDNFFCTWQLVQSTANVGEAGLTRQGWEKWVAVAREILGGNPVTNVLNAAHAKFQFSKWSHDDGARRTNRWLTDHLSARDDDRPFFLFVNYLEPHLEYRPPEEFAERFLPAEVDYEEAMQVPQNAWKYVTGQVELSDHDFEVLRALYAAEIAYLDSRIEELVAFLEADGSWDDTVFVVVGDHGENIGDHGLMDHQYCLYDTLLHVPVIATGGRFSGGGEDDRLLQLVDLPPTLVDEAGFDASAFRQQVQGASVFESDGERSHVFAEYMAPQPSPEAIEERVGDPDGVMEHYDRSLRCVREDGHKLVVGSDGSTELYDVEADPEETTDVSAERPAVVRDLEETLEEWLNSFERPEPSPDVAVADTVKSTLEDLGYIQ